MKFIAVSAVLVTVAVVARGQKPLVDFDYGKSVFKLDEGQQSNKQRFLRSSVLTGYREGVAPNTRTPYFEIYRDEATGTAKVGIYNLSIVEMLRLVPVDPRKVILNVKEPSKYMYLPEYGDRLTWLRKNGRCFEYTMPEAVIGKGDGPEQTPFRTELTRLLGVKVTYESRPLKVLVLYRTSDVDKIRSKGVNTGANGTIDEKGKVRNIKMGNLGTTLSDAGHPLMIDETSYKEAVDMDLNISSWKDLIEVRKALQRYGLDLKEDVRQVKNVMVVTEINQK